MKIMTTRNDLANWVDTAMGENANEPIVEAVTDSIQRDSNRPNWGEDWAEYLDSLDLWSMAPSEAESR